MFFLFKKNQFQSLKYNQHLLLKEIKIMKEKLEKLMINCLIFILKIMLWINLLILNLITYIKNCNYIFKN